MSRKILKSVNVKCWHCCNAFGSIEKHARGNGSTILWRPKGSNLTRAPDRQDVVLVCTCKRAPKTFRVYWVNLYRISVMVRNNEFQTDPVLGSDLKRFGIPDAKKGSVVRAYRLVREEQLKFQTEMREDATASRRQVAAKGRKFTGRVTIEEILSLAPPLPGEEGY